jgi:(2Fe-2S) ferredoxin
VTHALPAAAAEPAAPDPADRADLPGLTACRLCAGETLAGVDPLPGGQAARVAALSDVARLAGADCLDECERGDVLVVRPGRRGRRAGRRPVWFERLAGDADTAALRGWLADGGPGRAPLPAALAPRVLRRAAPEAPEPAVAG